MKTLSLSSVLSIVAVAITSLLFFACASISTEQERKIASTPSCFVRVIQLQGKDAHIQLIKRTAMSYQEEIVMKDEYSGENINSFIETCKKLQADNECICNGKEK